MAGFKGQYEYAIDEKGRLAIPAKMRRVLTPDANETFTATRGLESCIALYPLDYWEQLEDSFRRLNTYQKETRDFLHTITRWAEDVTLDKQGRVVLPKRLMDFAGITEAAVVIGSLDHIEVWAPQPFAEYVDGIPEDYETIAERVMGG